MHDVHVDGIPDWVDASRLLGPGDWTADDDGARARLSRAAAADVAARLRGVGLDGRLLVVTATPTLPRAAVRAGRTRDARARRQATPGFTRKGTRLDDEGRLSLTPEALALAVGRWASGAPVVDAGCGAGGNAIGFARAGSAVHAIERDPARAELARHNARVYGVGDRVTVETADALTRLQTLASTPTASETIVFCDPPWGADWNRARCEVDDFPLLAALLALRPSFASFWAKLPPSFATATWPGPHRATAVFGDADGDRHRVKFVVVRSA